MKTKSLALAGRIAAVFAAGWFVMFGPISALVISTPVSIVAALDAADVSGLHWQAVQSEVPVGQAVRIEVQLVGAGDAIVENVTITQTRLDMGPDGMATMTAPVTQVTASAPGIIAFEADFTMAGRWALSLTGTVDGQAEPVTGVVIFTAVEKKADAAAASRPSGERKILYYRNPMGLPDTSPVPKKDWMGMDYIPVYADEANDPPGTVRVSLEKVQRAGVRTEPAMRRDLTRTVRAVGTIEADESRLAIVTAKFAGFVEELFVPVTGAEVRAGEPLMRVWIESPEILQKQADYLVALRGSTGGAADIARAERNLRLFGLPDQAIEHLRQARTAVRSLVLTAPQDGTVIQKPALVGMRFGPGDMLFKTADLSTVWIMAQVAERDLALIRAGQTARIALSAYPDEDCDGRVAFIYPELNLTTRTAMVRIEHPNPDRHLRLGLYADVEIETGADQAPVVAIPDSAIIDSGTRRVAFVAKGDGVFEPREVTIGRRGDGFVEVRAGIAEGERIVVAGNFLIDAESNLRAALAVVRSARHDAMIAGVIRWSANNLVLVMIAAAIITLAGLYAVTRIPLDAIPDLSDTQVIVYTEYPGQAPQVIEDQVTFPLTTAMLSVPRSRVVRGFSFFGVSFVYVIFEDGTDIYWARSRVLEYLNVAARRLPRRRDAGARPGCQRRRLGLSVRDQCQVTGI